MKRISIVVTCVVFLGSFAFVGADEQTQDNDGEQTLVTASAIVKTCDESATEIGRLDLSERSSDEGIKLIDVRLEITGGLTPGKHGVHLHETGTCVPCGAANGHFDPGPNSNSSPDGNHPFHAGDLINIKIDEDGAGVMTTISSRVTLSEGPMSLFDADGSAVIVHVDEDTYCPEGAVKGCAGGGRAACGLISLDH